jgi:hypothetical protein
MLGLFRKRRCPSWRQRIERKVDILMANFSDLKNALDAATAKVAAIRADTRSLLDKISALQANPPSGMTTEQQAQLDEAVTTAQSLVTALGEVDDQVNPPAPSETPAPAPAEQPAPAPAEQPAPTEPPTAPAT